MAEKIRLAIIGSTKGTDMQAIIDAIARKEINAEIVLVASNNKDAFILERAKKNNIATFIMDYSLSKERSDVERPLVAELKRKKAELILLIGFGKILTQYFVNEFAGRVWNMHPSLLPKYPGGFNLDVHAKVLGNNEKESGCTLHEVVEKVDGGRILMQKKCEIVPGETPETLKEKVQKLEQECFVEAIKMVSEGKIIIGQNG